MDILTTAAIAYVSKDGIEKLLGPTFEYYGQGLKNTIESFNVNAKENLRRIFGRAIVKKGEKLSEIGKVSPRIIKEIVLDGAFCDSNIIQEYYSGILASARTMEGNDDNIHFINVLKGLSARQLKLHYAIYSKLFNEHNKEEHNLHAQKERSKLKVYFSLQEIIKIFEVEDLNRLNELTSQDFPVMYSTDLVEGYSFDTTKNDEKQFEFSITLFGVSLFLHALGYGDVFAPKCLSNDKIDEIIKSILSIDEL